MAHVVLSVLGMADGSTDCRLLGPLISAMLSANTSTHMSIRKFAHTPIHVYKGEIAALSGGDEGALQHLEVALDVLHGRAERRCGSHLGHWRSIRLNPKAPGTLAIG